MWTHFMTALSHFLYILKLDEAIGASHMAIFGKGKRNKERRYEGKEKKTREKLKKKKNKFKDGTRSLNGLKIERQSMQKLKESH